MKTFIIFIIMSICLLIKTNGQTNPMGKTWIVFIENSSYANFPSISSPTQDINQLKNVFQDYQVDKIIHKKNMSQQDLTSFFNRELMTLVKENNVNSVLIWYAGHGKVINATSYWIPVDAKRDNENSFYDITHLQEALSAYSKQITHTLLITDACESGPSFYHAMRSINTQQKCDDSQSINSKSSQILTSSGNRYGNDQSVFTKTFVSTLNENANSCIPIDYIAIQISKIAVQNNQNKPQFGRISNLDDDNGTFFFIKK